MDKQKRLRALRNIVIELVVYGTLVTLYARGVLRPLVTPLAYLYESSLTVYAWGPPWP